MTPALARVPTKDSGIEWVGAIPAHWNVLPFYSFADEVANPNAGLRERNLLSLSYGRIVRKDMERLEGLVPASFEGYNVIEANDIVFRLTDLQNDQTSLRSARATERGIITSAYVSVRPRVNSRFFDYLMRAYDTAKVFYGIGGGIRQSMKFADLKRIPVVVPLGHEMEGIANYLDCETARIDTLIAKKTRFIELLREKRQALITHAVTKGLDASVPMKDSGVEWLGNYPAHWRLKRLRRLVAFNPAPDWTLLKKIQAEYPFFPMEAIGETGEVDDSRRKPLSESRAGYSYFANGDVTYAKVTPCFENGKGAVMRGLEGGHGFGTTELTVLRPRKIDPKFLYFVTQTTCFRSPGAAHMLGAGGLKRVPDGFARDYVVGLPPSEEQACISDYLENGTSRIDTLIAKTERSIELLREHRAALITAAVTGKIDLRDAA